ncbi:unnamed protein product, partial [marine sediment metagenome]
MPSTSWVPLNISAPFPDRLSENIIKAFVVFAFVALEKVWFATSYPAERAFLEMRFATPKEKLIESE